MNGSDQVDKEWDGGLGGVVLGKAARALEREICDRCLGRLFARSGYRLTNQERGRSVRVVLALVAEALSDRTGPGGHQLMGKLPVHSTTVGVSDEPPEVPEDDQEWNTVGEGMSSPPWEEPSTEGEGCWLCHDLFDHVGELSELVIEKASGIEFSSFLIGCRVDPGTSSRENLIWKDVDPTSAEPLKEEVNRDVGKILDALWSDREVEKGNPEITFIVDPLFKQVDVQIRPLFIGGRYRKLERGIPQTRWPCHTCRGKGCPRCDGKGSLYKTSVEQLIGPTIMEAAKGKNYKLHGMGREDVDVLTLGSGRPFILEISSPEVRTLDIDDLFSKINAGSVGKVEVLEPRWTDRKEIPDLKSRKVKKRYCARVIFSETVDEERLKSGLSQLAESPIKQRTPERVAHRRADLIRERSLHEVDARILDDGKGEVTVLADGGLYIKELLHGDEGRTKPSLASILDLQIEVESLTVLEVLDRTE
ncbi:MAG: tRNA pseudouridine(54/55) synthase Pus10 [Thermoplasmata archaeon]|nr:tRNA pseudouridine(54/55) synthase Pus10 [Thermoplasmata archaeon]